MGEDKGGGHCIPHSGAPPVLLIMLVPRPPLSGCGASQGHPREAEILLKHTETNGLGIVAHALPRALGTSREAPQGPIKPKTARLTIFSADLSAEAAPCRRRSNVLPGNLRGKCDCWPYPDKLVLITCPRPPSFDSYFWKICSHPFPLKTTCGNRVRNPFPRSYLRRPPWPRALLTYFADLLQGLL